MTKVHQEKLLSGDDEIEDAVEVPDPEAVEPQPDVNPDALAEALSQISAQYGYVLRSVHIARPVGQTGCYGEHTYQMSKPNA